MSAAASRKRPAEESAPAAATTASCGTEEVAPRVSMVLLYGRPLCFEADKTIRQGCPISCADLAYPAFRRSPVDGVERWFVGAPLILNSPPARNTCRLDTVNRLFTTDDIAGGFINGPLTTHKAFSAIRDKTLEAAVTAAFKATDAPTIAAFTNTLREYLCDSSILKDQLDHLASRAFWVLSSAAAKWKFALAVDNVACHILGADPEELIAIAARGATPVWNSETRSGPKTAAYRRLRMLLGIELFGHGAAWNRALSIESGLNSICGKAMKTRHAAYTATRAERDLLETRFEYIGDTEMDPDLNDEEEEDPALTEAKHKAGAFLTDCDSDTDTFKVEYLGPGPAAPADND